MAVIKKKKSDDGGGSRRRSNRGKDIEAAKKVAAEEAKLAAQYAAKDDGAEDDEKKDVPDCHPLEEWSHEQVMEWVNEALPKQRNTLRFFQAQKIDGPTLFKVNRQWMMDNRIGSKEKVLKAIDELKTRLHDEKLKRLREEMKKAMLDKKTSEWDSDEDNEQALIDKMEKKRDELRQLWETPKSKRDWMEEKKSFPKLLARDAAEETSRFRMMNKLSSFERDRLDGEKYCKTMAKQREFFRLPYPEQQRRKRARKATRNLLVQLKVHSLMPQRKPNFSKHPYITSRFKQEAKSKRRAKCTPQLTLRILKQRMPENERWKVTWLMNEKGKFEEFAATKALVENRYFLSAAHSQLMKMSQRKPYQIEMIEKYHHILRTVDIFKKITDDSIEEICCAMEEKMFQHGNRIMTEAKSGQSMFVLVKGRVVASRIVAATGGISKPKMVTEFNNYKSTEYFGIKQPFQFDCTSVQNTIVLSIPRGLVEDIIGQKKLQDAAPDGSLMEDRVRGGRKPSAMRKKKRKKKARASAGMTGNKWLGAGDDQTDAEQGEPKLRRRVSFQPDDNVSEFTESDIGPASLSKNISSMTIREALDLGDAGLGL